MLPVFPPLNLALLQCVYVACFSSFISSSVWCMLPVFEKPLFPLHQCVYVARLCRFMLGNVFPPLSPLNQCVKKRCNVFHPLSPLGDNSVCKTLQAFFLLYLLITSMFILPVFPPLSPLHQCVYVARFSSTLSPLDQCVKDCLFFLLYVLLTSVCTLPVFLPFSPHH